MVGRKKEIKELQSCYESSESEFVAVYGRRRVGKTYLIRSVFSEKFVFQHSGLAKGGMKKQLRHFMGSLRECGWAVKRPLSDWIDAFDELKELIKSSALDRKVVFIDEMPWLDTPRSGFITALESFWNSWTCHRKNLMFVVCGSANSWMLDNLVYNHGGLYGRTTYEIKLTPFSLAECEQFCKSRGLRMSRYDMVQANMILGGIPYYMNYFVPEKSLPQNIDSLFFARNAPLQK